MNAPRKFVTCLLVLGLSLTEACNKRKPVLPPHSPAPTIATELPDEIPEIPEAPAPEVAQAPPEPTPAKTKPKKPARTVAKKTTPPASAPAAAATTPAPANNTQTVAGLRPPSSGLPPDTAIAAAVSSEQITRQKASTAQIVDATENSLKGLSRQLSDEEKAMKTQIQSYLQQSRKATTDGDFERAYNLAKKAQLLADALLKR